MNTGRFEECGPGILTKYHELKTLREEGFTHFQFGPGEFRYKRIFKTQDVPCYEGFIANPKSLPARLLIEQKKRSQPVEPVHCEA